MFEATTLHLHPIPASLSFQTQIQGLLPSGPGVCPWSPEAQKATCPSTPCQVSLLYPLVSLTQNCSLWLQSLLFFSLFPLWRQRLLLSIPKKSGLSPILSSSSSSSHLSRFSVLSCSAVQLTHTRWYREALLPWHLDFKTYPGLNI